MYSCRTDNNIVQDQKIKEVSIAKQISYQSLLNALGNEDKIIVNKKTSFKNKKNDNILENFEIDKSKILFIKNKLGEDYYSMRIFPKANISKLYFYNLYIKKDSNGNINQTIVEYAPTIETILNDYKNFRGNYKIIYSDTKKNTKSAKTSSDPCLQIWIEVACDNGYVHPENGPGEWCDANGSWCFYAFDCSVGGSSGSGSISGNNNGDGSDGNGGSVLIPPSGGTNHIASCEVQDTDDFIVNLYYQNQNWANNNIYTFNNLVNSLCSNNSQENKDFVSWGANFLSQNPNTSWEQFQNWFMGESEGQDGEYDASYWENPNLTFPAQSLPSWSDFSAAYPGHHDPKYNTPTLLYNAIGGAVLANGLTNGDNSNTCAARLSMALNYSKVLIPNIPGKTFKGGDNKYYFLGAANMIAWMKKTFGTTTNQNYIHIDGSQGGTNGSGFSGLLNGKKGIYGMLPNVPFPPQNNPNAPSFHATGHVDLFGNSICDGGCFFGASGGVKEIVFWILN